MASSTSNLDLLTNGQAGHAYTANDLFNAGSPCTLFGRREKLCTGLNWYFYGGMILVNGVFTAVVNNASPLVLTASQNNYIECTDAGVVTANTSAFTPGRIPLYLAVTNTTSVTSYTDYRTCVLLPNVPGWKSKALSDANVTLTQAEAACGILEFTGTLSVQRNVVVPLRAQQWTVCNNTSGGFGLQFIGASGTGTVVAAGKRAIIYSDGTNVVRVTADV